MPVYKINAYKDFILFFIIAFFAVMFFVVEAYWVAFATLVLLVIATRIYDIKNLSFGKNGLAADFRSKSKELTNLIKSKASVDTKIKISQKLTNEIFKLGYRAGGGKSFNDISNVTVNRDKNGEIESYQYDEN